MAKMKSGSSGDGNQDSFGVFTMSVPGSPRSRRRSTSGWRVSYATSLWHCLIYPAIEEADPLLRPRSVTRHCSVMQLGPYRSCVTDHVVVEPQIKCAAHGIAIDHSSEIPFGIICHHPNVSEIDHWLAERPRQRNC
jgi:hypothetical protein